MAVTAHVSAYADDANDPYLQTVHIGPYQAAGLADGNYFVGVIPFAGDVEKITIRQSALAAAAADQITFKIAAPGTAPASAVAITAAEGLDATNNGGTAMVIDQSYDIPILAAGKNLASGSILTFSTAGTIASTANLHITVTYRKGGYRTTDNGRKFYEHKPTTGL